MFDNLEMPWSWPVEINYHEAKAYCSWKGSDYRLFTEAEHNAIRGNQVMISNQKCCKYLFNFSEIILIILTTETEIIFIV